MFKTCLSWMLSTVAQKGIFSWILLAPLETIRTTTMLLHEYSWRQWCCPSLYQQCSNHGLSWPQYHAITSPHLRSRMYCALLGASIGGLRKGGIDEKVGEEIKGYLYLHQEPSCISSNISKVVSEPFHPFAYGDPLCNKWLFRIRPLTKHNIAAIFIENSTNDVVF